MDVGQAMTRAREFDEDVHCGAKTRKGTPCMRRKGAGTDHVGAGHCSTHLGNTQTGLVHAAREAAQEVAREVALLAGNGVQISPAEGLLTCINMTWAQVQFFGEQIAKLELKQITTRPMREGSVGSGEHAWVADMQLEERLNLWVLEKQRALDRLAKYSKQALDAGVAQQQIELARAQGANLGRVVRGILEELDLTRDQMKLLPAVLRRHMEHIVQPSLTGR